jgi:hypothetical protein
VTETFEVGQRVRHDAHGEAEITYGPFRDTFGRTRYVVRLASGTETPLVAGTLSAVPEPPAFDIGDKVMPNIGHSGKLVAGPFNSRSHDFGYWVVEGEDGKHSSHSAQYLTKVVESEPIKVGDRVRVTDDDGGGRNRFNGLIGTVKELRGEGHSLPYLVEFGDGRGHHGALNGRWHCGAVERVADEDTHAHNGVTYDLSAKYRDRDGDVWRFQRMSDGAVHGRWTAGPIEVHHSTLAEVADECGPLTRV